MRAYLVNSHYLFTDYEELASHVHDVVHYTTSEEKGSHLFSIIKGEVYWERLIFISEHGEEIPLQYEQEEDFYYSEKLEIG